MGTRRRVWRAAACVAVAVAAVAAAAALLDAAAVAPFLPSSLIFCGGEDQNDTDRPKKNPLFFLTPPS